MDLNDTDTGPDRESRLHRALWRHWGTPASIYGTVVYASVVAAASGGQTDRGSVARLLVLSVVSIVVFWTAHVYSTALGYQPTEEHMGARVRDALGHALRESGGMLEAAIVPSIPLLLGSLALLPPVLSVYLSLWFSVLMLALLGYSVFALRRRPVVICLAGAITSGLFGVIVIVLKSSLQH